MMLAETTWPEVGMAFVQLLNVFLDKVLVPLLAVVIPGIVYWYKLRTLSEKADTSITASKAAAAASGENFKEIKANTVLTQDIKEELVAASNGHSAAAALEAKNAAETAKEAAKMVSEAAADAAAVLAAAPARELVVAHIQLDDVMRELSAPGEQKEVYVGTISDKMNAVQRGLLAKVKELERQNREKDERIEAMGGAITGLSPRVKTGGSHAVR